MKPLQFVRADADFTSHAGLALVGQALSSGTELRGDLERLGLRHGTSHADVMLAYTGLVSLGKNDFEALHTIDSPACFTRAMGLERIPSEATLRQRMDQRAAPFEAVVKKANRDFLVRSQPTLTPVSTGHVPIEIEGWWTSLSDEASTVIGLYADHGTSEQFHSEFRTDLDIERLPSGRFATNALVVATSVLACNVLRWIGQHGLTGMHAPRRHKARRRRLRTVVQELMYVAARLVRSARQTRLVFGRDCPAFEAFHLVYCRLASP